ncbi:MAG: phospholipase [Deltaproteobacteria bacterium]|nr:phospholipase [Deltaproteobacteria bacterium]
MNTLTTQMGELNCRIVGAENPSFVVVLCHGYGAPGTDLVPMARELLYLKPDLADRVRFLFPEAPLTLPGFFGGRAWWQIDVARYERAMRTGELRDMRTEVPEGLAPSRRKLMALLELAQVETGLPMSRFLIGGFSQGAMLATDVTLRLEEAPAGLAALSGTLLCEEEWLPRAAKRAGLPVLQSHGRIDPILPYQAAEWLRELLEESGLDVEFIPFDGAHTIPGESMIALASLIERLATVD